MNLDNEEVTADYVRDFEQSVRSLDITSTRTSIDEFADTISEVTTDPAVGVGLPFDEVSLADTPVVTEPSPHELREAKTGVTPVGLGIAEHGTVLIQSRSEGDELVSLYPERHVPVIRARDVVPDVSTAFEWLDTEFAAGRTSVVFATGPSATGDMGAMVRGVHGPKDVHVIIIEEETDG